MAISILCQSLHAEALQATASEGLAESPYEAVRVGFEPATLRMEGNELTTEPPHPRLERIVSGSNAIRDYLSPKCYRPWQKRA